MDSTTQFNEKVERWSCGCSHEYLEFNGQWLLLAGEYCRYAERLLERGRRERNSPYVNVKRNADAYKKLLNIHRTKQDLTISFD